MTLPDALYLSGTKYTAATRYVGFRCLHIGEGGYQSDLNNPEVRPSFNAPAIPFTKDMQLLSFALNRHNPSYTGEKWRSVHWFKRAFNNNNGFDDPGDPRRDYVNGRDLQAVFANGLPALPKMMKAIICGGMFIRGDVANGELVCMPGVHAIDATKPMPTVDEVLARNWYFAAVTADEDSVVHFPQGNGLPVLIPYFLAVQVTYPLSWFEPWDSSVLPNPLKIY